MMYRYLFTYLLVAVLNSNNSESTSCTAIVAEQQQAARAFTEITQAVGATATVKPAKGGVSSFQQAAFSQLNSGIKQTAAGVQISLDDKRLLVLRNDRAEQEETGVPTYRYRGTDHRNQLVWITKNLYEDTEQMMVSLTTGKQVKIANEPQLNLTSTLLFARQNACYEVYDDCLPGFQLWRIGKGALKLIKEVRLKHYAVVRGGWISAATVRLEIASTEDILSGKKVADMKRQFFDVTVR